MPVQVPIATGASQTLKGSAKSMFADFVHGHDGFGNTQQPSIKVGLVLHLLLFLWQAAQTDVSTHVSEHNKTKWLVCSGGSS